MKDIQLKDTLLLLLRSQLDLWGSPFLVRLLRMWPCFNPTIEVATFRHRGWYILGVLLPAFIRLGHECQALFIPYDACVHRLDLGLYSHPKEGFFFFGGGGEEGGRGVGVESEPMLTPKVKSPLPEAQRTVETVKLHHAEQRVRHTAGWAIPAPAERHKIKHFVSYCYWNRLDRQLQWKTTDGPSVARNGKPGEGNDQEDDQAEDVGWHSKEGGSHLEQDSMKQTTMGDNGGGYILQWMDNA